ncbi:MAG: glycoside hydrolase family 3 C-terminal domain-containing protein [Eubacterium sp.]|nr:glycoside hydrolase family 3 C-terminal domain-containing protein [Eubacterium sp.]MCM1216079.1 glycoside hydrolase family 3 C-terminal domain-containing protein [Lachnospiraceae bacterium]MCM1239812.1 glycoside hydrolase family 3 C-terminal domain-containing protein [Lachnospiraceae bacterium]MCM1343714.1 glycoside hydrolase family 3 C-terminal domain-containing protein [Muribaculaceae bacterium]MCM1410186.1 glycoside hydrolase family 3 C-terminal domain-containing protein [Lachnospiraceae 
MEPIEIAEKIAEESIVLLKNEERTLPFLKGQRIAFFGRSQIDTIYSGNGSGAAHGAKGKNILEECEKKGIHAEPDLKAYYRTKIGEEAREKKDDFDWSKLGEAVNSGIMYEIFGRYHAPLAEYEIPEDLLTQAGAFTDTALLVLGRNSGGEECDRHLDEDYYLTDSEKRLVGQVCRRFSKVVLILNINGLIDLAWVEKYESIKSILFIGIPGEEGARALAGILTGAVNPSGKLAVTIAKQYEDYPSAAHFSWDKEHSEKILTYESYGLSATDNGSNGYEKSPVTVYWEDIFAGYRYFDTFGKEPLFPFGYGLSYSEFEIKPIDAGKETDGIRVAASVKNVGHVPGKETLQLYLHTKDTAIIHARQELKGFGKTKLLAPQEEDTIVLTVPFREFAHYSEAMAAYVIEKGIYELYLGNSSENTAPVVRVTAKEDVLVEQCKNCLGLSPCNAGKIDFLTAEKSIGKDAQNCSLCKWELVLGREDVRKPDPEDRVEPERTEDDKVSRLSMEQLAAMCVGYGPGTPFSAFGDGSAPETIFDEDGEPVTTNSHPAGTNGYVSPAILKEDIRSVFYKDGPAGIGETAWPTEMLIACAFDKELWYRFGNAVGEECERQQVDVWLAPAVNLHRNPLGGRSFEYFSEDPYLTGICACEIAKGVQENHPVLVCPKHFAVNEQETYRRGSAKKNYDAVDSIIQERAVRELYLKPFEMLVKNADIACIMTSFNKINGIFTGGNQELCTRILRGEWGFEGVVVTDWGDMDVAVDGADAVAAGNDIVMPGGPPVIAQIRKGLEEGRVTRDDMERAVRNLLKMSARIV